MGDTRAAFESRCTWCDLSIEECDFIAFFDGEWLHEHCADDAREECGSEDE